MDFDLSDPIRQLPGDAAFRVANQARPPQNYLFATLLPEIADYDYQARAGNMTVRATMAGLVGMDSPFPEAGAIEVSDFNEDTAKLANRLRLPEAALRRLQAMLMRMRLSNQPTLEAVQREALNFLDKVIVQGHLDAMEYLRGMALTTGKIDWVFNNKRLLVDYGIPSANLLAQRTGSDAYDGSASKFWSDVRLLQKQLRYNMRALIAHSTTINVIVDNPVNAVEIVDQADGRFTLQRIVQRNGANVLSSDRREKITIVLYDDEGEIWDLSVPGATKKLPFMTPGKLLGVGNNTGTRYVVGQGSTPPPEMALGYTHIAPTVEGGGRPGRWADVRTPDGEPWSLEGRGVTNGLPVIEAYDKVAVASTAMPA